MGERRQSRMGGESEGGRKGEEGMLDDGGRVGRTKGFHLSLTQFCSGYFHFPKSLSLLEPESLTFHS